MEHTVKYTPFFLLGAVLIVSLVVGLLSRRRNKGGYGLQVRSISHANIGAAIASNWASLASMLASIRAKVASRSCFSFITSTTCSKTAPSALVSVGIFRVGSGLGSAVANFGLLDELGGPVRSVFSSASHLA